MLAVCETLETSPLFIMSATRKVSAIFRQVRIGVCLDLDVSLDAQILETNYLVITQLAFGGFSGGCKHPLVSGNLPIVAIQPFPGLFRMSAAHHPPQLIFDILIDTYKSGPCHHMAVVVAPTTKHLIQLLDQNRHGRADVFAGKYSHLSFEGEDSLLGRGDVQYITGLAIGLPEECKPVFNVRDRGFLR